MPVFAYIKKINAPISLNKVHDTIIIAMAIAIKIELHYEAL